MADLAPRPFVFVRHGETFYNRAGLVAGRLDVALTRLGERQAREAGELLGGFRWSYIAVSSQFRARKTARLLLPGARLHYHDGLRERDWGVLEGGPLQAPMPYFDEPAQGESWEIFRSRVLAALNAVIERYEWPLIVAHSGVFRVIRHATSGSLDGPRVGNVEPVVCQPPGRPGGNWELLSCYQEPEALNSLTALRRC
ncbi:histidine phosphatase family protein [Kushneria aurantia]|uniref:Histidine phosphatase family protein n=1 Tax=Kushneria aurantia TaxID=504092 RepID=A0ABV6FYV6_9GAMM|nr:histidine phosphatase family protein [Kushneria aurantia]